MLAVPVSPSDNAGDQESKREHAISTGSADRRIPSLDGLRAVSIAMVIVAHSHWFLPISVQNSLAFRSIIGGGRSGVAVFFVISGYLITSLLRKELKKTNDISLKRFYFRRSLRIFPPYYFLLAVLAVFWIIGWIPENMPSFLSAATYTFALYPSASGYYIGHSWSLSIEELFYIFWPLTLAIGHRRQRAVHVAIALILLMPVVRLALYFLAPPLRGHENFMVQGWVDTMMIGCMLALVKGRPEWEQIHRRILKPWTVAVLTFIGFFLLPALLIWLPKKVSSVFDLALKPTLLALCIGGILVYLIENPSGVVGRILNNPVVRHIGVLSYSLYLWQQLFMSEKLNLLPYGYLYVFVAAEFSYWVVERPSLRLRGVLEQRFMRTEAVSQGGALR